MLYNVSYNRPDITRALENEVGKKLRFRESLLLKGTGSPKCIMTACSIHIHNLMVLDNNRNVCNIEMREKGIIIRFRSLLETYALPIAYYKLTIYKGRAAEYSIYRDDYFVKIEATEGVHKFMKKVLDAKGEQAFTYVDDL